MLAGVDPDDAMIVYLGDGVITSGARNLDALRAQIAGKAHFVGVGVGDGPDTQTLDALAAATGGYATTIDLADDVGWRAFDLVAALHTARVTGVELEARRREGALVPSTTYLASPQLADGEELELVAKLAGAGTPAAVELTGTRDGKPLDAAHRARRQHRARRRGYLPRLWAQRHIAARLLAKHDAVVVPACTPTVASVAAGDRVSDRSPAARAARRSDPPGDRHARQAVLPAVAPHVAARPRERRDVREVRRAQGQRRHLGGVSDAREDRRCRAAAGMTVATDVADDAELVRAPLQVFYNYGGYAVGRERRGLRRVRPRLEWTDDRHRRCRHARPRLGHRPGLWHLARVGARRWRHGRRSDARDARPRESRVEEQSFTTDHRRCDHRVAAALREEEALESDDFATKTKDRRHHGEARARLGG